MLTLSCFKVDEEAVGLAWKGTRARESRVATRISKCVAGSRPKYAATSEPCRYAVSAPRVSCWYAVSVPASLHSAYTSRRTPPPPPRTRRTMREAARAGVSLCVRVCVAVCVGVGVGVAVADGGLTGDPDAVDVDNGGDVHTLPNNPADSAALSMRATGVSGAVELELDAKAGETSEPGRAEGGAATTSCPRWAFAASVGVGGMLLPLLLPSLLPPPSSHPRPHPPPCHHRRRRPTAPPPRVSPLTRPHVLPRPTPPPALSFHAIPPSNSAPRPPAPPRPLAFGFTTLASRSPNRPGRARCPRRAPRPPRHVSDNESRRVGRRDKKQIKTKRKSSEEAQDGEDKEAVKMKVKEGEWQDAYFLRMPGTAAEKTTMGE
ncbi:hypothetical protein C8J57DRAFT_1563497 [Mycena rebaudengoi]|nr:hypothetical protein C8J57DRAFT_1563497 [Mycena rebaudengoi]